MKKPQVRTGIVQRPQLVMRLKQGLAKKLILVLVAVDLGMDTWWHWGSWMNTTLRLCVAGWSRWSSAWG